MQTEKETERSFFCKTDPIVIGLFLLVSLGIWAAGLFANRADRLKIEIYSDNTLIETISLPAQDRIIPIPGKNITLELKNNSVRFSETDCPDKTCSKTGFIGQSGQTAICLPNRVIVKVSGDTQTASEADGIAG